MKTTIVTALFVVLALTLVTIAVHSRKDELPPGVTHGTGNHSIQMDTNDSGDHYLASGEMETVFLLMRENAKLEEMVKELSWQLHPEWREKRIYFSSLEAITNTPHGH